MAEYKYTVEADAEQFTEADAESLEFTPEDVEGLETESTESINLEDVKAESVAESLESLMEGVEATGYGNGYGSYTSPSPTSPSRSVNKELLKIFTTMIKKLVPKITSNPKTRAKLQVAARKGPTAVAQLLTPSVVKLLPSYFRFLAPIYVPAVTGALFESICRAVGVKVEEVVEARRVRTPRALRGKSGAIGNALTAASLATSFLPK